MASQQATKRRTQAERSQETQERITAAATEILRRNGLARFRVADVAKEAGVSRGAQTHHFASKKDLILAVFASRFNYWVDVSRQRIANIRPEDDIVEAMITDASDFFLGPDFLLGLDLMASAERDADLREGVRQISQETRSLVEDMWIGMLQSRGLSKEDATDLLWLVFSAIRGLSVRIFKESDEHRFARLKKITYQVAWDLFKQRRENPSTADLQENTTKGDRR